MIQDKEMDEKKEKKKLNAIILATLILKQKIINMFYVLLFLYPL